MKIRNGFVSNSSSSSFIVPLKDIPSSVEDLQQMMFGDASEIGYMYTYCGPFFLDTRSLAEIVYRDIVESTLKTSDELIDEIREYWYGDNEETEEIELMVKKYPNHKIVRLHYSDGDGKYFTQLEHSGIIESTFKGSVRINQH